MENREPIISITKKDCRFDFYRGSGKGGQKRNKTSNCCRCTHLASGAVGKSEEGRSKEQNIKRAFRRMAESERFKVWLKIEVSKVTGEAKRIEKKVEQDMRKIRIEKRENGIWTEYKENPESIFVGGRGAGKTLIFEEDLKSENELKK